MKKNIPFSPPDLTDLEAESVKEAILSGWITTGPKTKLFEKKIAEYCGTSKAICLNSATACMELALRLLGIGPGDEVITSAYTYTASASVIDHVGAKIVLVDTDPETYHLSYEQLENAITEKTKAIIPVDIAGIMCDYDKIYDIVENKKPLFHANNDIQKLYDRIVIIADGAHSFGASFNGKISGSAADFTSFSFHAVKNLTTAEGGALTWKNMGQEVNDNFYSALNIMSLHGQTKDALSKTQLGSWEYDIVSLAYKCNMTDIAAAIGLVQLDRYESMLDIRHKLVKNYISGLDGLPIISEQHVSLSKKSSAHLFLTRLTGEWSSKRNEFILKLAEQGIAANVHYKPLPLLTGYKKLGFSIEDYPNAYNQFINEVTLPLRSNLSYKDQEYICKSIKEILD